MDDFTMDHESKQYIVTKLDEEQYGIDIYYIDNIVRMQKITRVPKTQSYFMGVINLRGEIIPVINIRLVFGLERIDINNNTRIIIIKLEGNEKVGILVDEVKEVVMLDSESIENATKEQQSMHLEGIGKHQNTLISILNINSLIAEIDNS